MSESCPTRDKTVPSVRSEITTFLEAHGMWSSCYKSDLIVWVWVCDTLHCNAWSVMGKMWILLLPCKVTNYNHHTFVIKTMWHVLKIHVDICFWLFLLLQMCICVAILWIIGPSITHQIYIVSSHFVSIWVLKALFSEKFPEFPEQINLILFVGCVFLSDWCLILSKSANRVTAKDTVKRYACNFTKFLDFVTDLVSELQTTPKCYNVSNLAQT